jgi:uncharacterized repeat protein (TIGR03806 family)
VAPLALIQAPGDSSRWYLVEKDGRVFRFANTDDVTTRTLFVDLSNAVDSWWEGGLLGMAFHPDFANNGYVYLSYTASDDTVGDHGANLRARISRFTVSADRRTLVAASEVNLLTVAQTHDHHNNGHIQFGADGYLYIAFGDGGYGDPFGNAQDLNSLFGKILRIDVNGPAPYGIPPDNPFVHGGGRAEIFAIGFRNPWRWSIDRDTGTLWVGDVGHEEWEEVNRVTLGGNYGWSVREGAHCHTPNCSGSGFTDPVVEYSHDGGRCSITGGYVYRGNAIPSLRGSYVAADFCSGEILVRTSGTNRIEPLASAGIAISSFGEGNDGELYALDYFNGAILRIVAGSGAIDTIAQKLSETGCVNPADPRQPASGMIGYDVNAPLWSDGAGKLRFLGLPAGARIGVGADQDWSFPVGTVLMKHFHLFNKLIETRLFMRHPDGEWGGYSYEWNADQTDAQLLTTSKDVDIGGQSWHFPSGGECMRCHTGEAGRALGPETSQMNRAFLYQPGNVTANQIAAYQHFGLFSNPPGDPAALPRLAAPGDTGAPLEQRARAYLHTNCSGCHRPGGSTQSVMDLRHDTPLAAANVCNTSPRNGDLGIAGARLLLPGDPGRSLIAVRMRALDGNRMPPLSTSVVDAEGVTLIDNWIASISACP